MRFLLRWQRVAKHTQVIGPDGLARVIEQLQGFETAAGAWEREVLPARLHGYEQAWLDQLCLAGHVVWARLSPRSAPVEVAEEPEVSPPPRKKPRPADPTDPYNIAELAADAACRAGASRDEIAAAAAAALTGQRTPGYGEQVIVQLVTTSALMRRASERAAYEEATAAMRPAFTPDDSDDAPMSTPFDDPSFVAVATALIDSADARDSFDPRAPIEVLDARRAKPVTPPKRTAPGRSAPLALMLRADAMWLRAAASVTQGEPAPLSSLATEVRDALAAHGASFLGDLAHFVELPPNEIEDALWELVGAGIATADGFASLRVLVDRKRGEVKSLFDKARDAQRIAQDAAVPSVRKWQDAIKKARTRDHLRPGHALRSLPTAAGRWSLLPAANPTAVDAEASARQLLRRYGVVFRDLVQRESSLPPWRDILVALRRLEARGEIRGGRFVNGFVGEQFALPEALEELRAVRNPAPSSCVARVAATDPLNLVGILSPGSRVPAIVGNAVLFVDGHAVASIEAGQLVLRAPLPPGARVDEDLVYIPPPRPLQSAPQVTLPL